MRWLSMRVISPATAMVPGLALILWLLVQGRGNSIARWAQSMAASCEKASNEPPPNMELATFGGGCFWGLELKFQRVPGVHKTSVGYANGQTDNPTYEAVCSGRTGYTEAVQVRASNRSCIGCARMRHRGACRVSRVTHACICVVALHAVRAHPCPACALQILQHACPPLHTSCHLPA